MMFKPTLSLLTLAVISLAAGAQDAPKPTAPNGTPAAAAAPGAAPQAPRPPADPTAPKPFAEAVWTVDSALGPAVPVRMSAVRLANGDLLLHSPTRYDPGLRAMLERIGPDDPGAVGELHSKSLQRF